jgi:hypothetical protein
VATLHHLANAARLALRGRALPVLVAAPARPSWWLVRQGVMSLGSRDAEGLRRETFDRPGRVARTLAR